MHLNKNHPDVIIVGAGITGCATALALAESGAKVEVIERYHAGAMARVGLLPELAIRQGSS